MWVEKNGRTWRIRDEVNGRKVDLGAGYPTKSSARAAMVLLRADEMRGDALLPRGGRVTLNAFLDEWWPSYERSLKTTSADSEGARIRNHIRPLLGELTLDEIDSATVQRWVDDLGAGVGTWVARGRRKPLAAKTVHNAHGLLFVIFAAAIAAKRLRSNPCGSTNLPARTHREMMFLTDPEIARLIRAMPEHWRPLVLLLVATGLRWGEAIGLKAGRVDLLAARPRLLVVEQLQERAGAGSDLYFTSPKSARSRRTVSFTKQVALALTPVVAGKREDEVIFTTVTGLMVRTRNFRRIWLKAIARAGLPGLRIHDLRHSHAAILIAANRQLSAISRRLGHSSIAVTDALYGHLREEVDDGILDAVTAALSQVSAEDLEAELEDELADALS